MAIAGSSKVAKLNAKNVSKRSRDRRREMSRKVLLENLEVRHLLAVGPQLISIQPNEGGLLTDGVTYNVSPRELVFRFDDSTSIDSSTLGGIRLLRSGGDGVFDRAYVSTDLGTNAEVVLDFAAVAPGSAGNGIEIRFTKASYNGTSLPRINVSGRTINVELNVNFSFKTRATDLIRAMQNNAAASALVTVNRLRGSEFAFVTDGISSGHTLTLSGAGASRSSTNFNAGSQLQVEFLSELAASNVQLVFTSRDRGQSVAPAVTVSNSTVRVELNSNARTPSTVQEVINAINGDAIASGLVRARLVSGSAATRVGGLAINYSPISLTGNSDIAITPAFVGVGDSPREVIMRFAEPLPDDLYRIDILGSGPFALRNINGERFNGGVDSTIRFSLDLGARIESVIPQPIVRNANGSLTQLRNEIHVYFNDDDLDPASASNPRFYQLRYTRGTLTGNDDLIFYPSRVDYSAALDRAVLTFNRNLDELVDPGTGNQLPLSVLRLRIGTDEERFDPPAVFTPAADPGSEFATAVNITPQFSPTVDRPKSIIINSEIVNTTPYTIDFPGGNNEPGNRNNRYQQHVTRVDADGIDVIEYNFQSELGRSGGSIQLNAITETQKQRVREIMTLYSNYLGARFVETDARGMTIAVGDMQAVVGGQANAPGGLLLAAGALVSNGQPAVVIDIQDFNSATENAFGTSLFRSFMQGIGLLLGLGRADELPNLTVQSSQPITNPGIDTEMVFPGNHDIVHGQHVLRPEGKDIDLYRFSLPERGELRIETFAERLADASLLDTHLRLYQRQPDGTYVEIAANGDYFSQDSMIRLNVRAGHYIVGVSAKGNDTYDPRVVDSGLGGKSEGRYQLRIDFRPPEQSFMVDSSAPGKGGAVRIDGDGDGRPGGTFNFWFMPTGPQNTIYVDKAAPNANGDGSLGAPFRRINQALTASRAGTVVRIVGNGGADGRLETTSDNLAYEIGFNRFGQAMADGTTFDVPKDVTVMIDAGAILKLYRSRISVGSTSVSVDRSGSSLQVLGLPRIIDASGRVVTDLQGDPIPGHVYFTSLHDRIGRGGNSDTNPPNPRAGDWGGIDFRNLIDGSDDTRTDLERNGLFVNSIVHGAFRYGGGQVVIDGVSQIVNPIQMLDSRPTIVGNVITNSADAAMSATPNSFKESNFHDPISQSAGVFVADFERVGPAIHGNKLTGNSINGLFVKVRTAPGAPLEKMTFVGRFDDSSIVHVISENLVIAGNPGGVVMETNVPPSATVTLSRRAGGNLATGTYNYKLVYVDAQGNETPASEATMSLTVPGSSSIVLNGLPPIRSGVPFVARRIYRSDATGGGEYRFVAQINANSTSFTDNGSVSGGVLNEANAKMLARLHGSLTVDPGMVLKLQGARIEVEMGASLIAEGQDGGYIVMTSINDTRYGAGGTFDTANANGRRSATAGDWGGIYVGHTSSASLDYVRVQYAGGVTRTDGFVSFNAIEAHQASLRVANSRIENSADGFASDFSTRGGRGTNFPATIFVRGSQPILVNNRIVNNAGPAINIDVNSLDWSIRTDTGRSSGALGRVSSTVANRGPLVSGNQLDRNGVNGMVVRGQELTTQSVWDDTDIVHVVLDEIVSSNFHTYGGLRLQSAPNASLVVKFSGIEGGVAGLTATGLPLDIADRIGGTIQIVGQPGFPVVLTSLSDDSVGAGFTPDGRPQVDTDGRDANAVIKLPTGPEVDNGTLIDNDVDPGIPGQFAFRAGAGGRSGFATPDGAGGGISAQGNTQLFVNTDAIFEFFNFIDVGANGQAFELGTTNITQPPSLVDDDLVVSQGTFTGNNGSQVRWRVESRLDDGIATVYNRLTLESDQPLGNMLFINYLDEDVLGPSDDLLYLVGTPGLDDFRAFTLDGPERIGFAHGGVYFPGSDLVNASYEGWTADTYANLLTNIQTGGTQYSVPGNINTANLPPFNDPTLGQVYGLRDITTAFAWRVDPNATTATMMSFLELVPSDPGTSARSGDWRGIELQTYSNDRNVATVVESESGLNTAVGANDIPNRSQYLGHLSDRTVGGDENVRLGYEIHGAISQPSDVDVYSFTAFGGTEVWLDIDRTSYGLDTVVELIDANGNILALSDNSFDEEADPSLLFRSNRLADTAVHPLRKSTLALFPTNASGSARDLYSTNPKDAGFRVVLPGQPNSRTLYHVRVRSSNLMPGDPRTKLTDPREIRSGQSTGAYQLQIRLREEDEIPGSGISYADVRFAQNGVVLSGLPRHSPLVGETAEQEARDLNGNGVIDPGEPADNNVFANAQELGNLLQTDRQAISLSGRVDSPTDVDWFTFTIDYQLLLTPLVEYFSTIFDMDYADGVGRPNTTMYVFDDAGRLVYNGNRSNLVDDRARPGRGADNTDLSRGSTGTFDPFIGPVELRQGRYFLAVTNARMVPRILFDPLVRLQPTSSTRLIVEDHVERVGGSTAVAPILPQLIQPSTGVVPYTLGDMVLYVSQDTGFANTTVRMINPMTGNVTNLVGTFNSDVRDIAFRFNGNLQGYTTPIESTAAGDRDPLSDYVTIDSGTGVITVGGNLGIETFHPDPADPAAALESDVGINVEALTFTDLVGNEVGFVVGNRGPGPGAGGYNTNILYLINPGTGAAISSPLRNRIAQNNGPDERVFGAGTDIVERGQINTAAPAGAVSRRLVVTEATRTVGQGPSNFLINDGTRFSVRDSANFLYVFEFDSGPQLRLTHNPAQGRFMRDGDRFSIDGATYEFDTGGVVVVNSLDGSTMVDGTIVTITDGTANAVVRRFEFDRNNSLTNANHVRVPYTIGSTQAEMVQALVNAINSAGFGARAIGLPGSNRITVTGKSTTANMTTSSSSVSIDGGVGLTNVLPVATPISIHETMTTAEFVAAIRSAVQGSVQVGFDGNRLNFAGAQSGSFTSFAARNVGTDLNTQGGESLPGAIPILFLAEDTEDTIAARVAAAINAQSMPGTTATSSGRDVNITLARFETAADPLRLGDIAPGGLVTGIAVIGNSLYAVSNAGGLYQVNNPASTQGFFGGQVGNYVRTSTDLLGIQFTGLTAGPRNLEGGRYSNILFGTDVTGRIHAFDTSGRLVPVFANGATSIATGIPGINGLAFSTLDFNLWHISENRGSDAGHGMLPTPDISNAGSPGGSSWYFGFESPTAHPNATFTSVQDPTIRNSYNFPGGAEGVLESRPFSLSGIAAADLPALYFNYFVATEDANSNAVDGQNYMLDSFRAYIMSANGRWELLATNNSDRGPGVADDEFDPLISGTNATVELFDNTVTWRQANVDLSRYAGQENLKLRFEFSTAGGLGYGRFGGRGPEIRLTPGSQIRDGQQLTIGGRVFEIEMGPTLVVPPGSQLTNGSFVDVEGVQFVFFDGNGTPPANGTVVPFARSESASVIAQRLLDAINSAQYPKATIAGLNFSDEVLGHNDVTGRAFVSPINGERITISGQGAIGDNPSLIGNPDRDVDMISMRLKRGMQVTASTLTVNSTLDPLLRLFDSAGRELARNDDFGSKDSRIVFTVPSDGEYFLGVSASGNALYNAVVFGTANLGGTQGAYELTIDVDAPVTGVLVGNRIQLPGVDNLGTAANSPIAIEGGSGSNGIPVFVNLDDDANAIGRALRDAIAGSFAGGSTGSYLLHEDFLRLDGLTVENAGPFTVTQNRNEDIFSEFAEVPAINRPAFRAQNNNFEGIYLDDFFIGISERGEMTLGSVIDTVFVDTGPTGGIEVGPYQLEIRGASDFGTPLTPRTQINDVELILTQAFEPNERLVDGQSIRFRSGVEIGDGDSFSISDGIATMTFEFEDSVRRNGVTPGNVPVLFSPNTIDPVTGITRATTAGEIAAIVRNLINSNTVQSVLNISANMINGDSQGASSDSLAIFGNPTITIPASIGDLIITRGYGDKNRDRDQGQIIIENSRFSDSAGFGLVVTADPRDAVSDAPNPGSIRSTVVLNNERLVPGAVIRNNEFLFNASGGMDIQGEAATAFRPAAPIPMARIYNNTIVGGTITLPTRPEAQVFGDVLFPLGTLSFADAVVSYNPNFSGGPAPIAGLQNATNALGAPNYTGSGEPLPGQGAVSLGRGGQLVIQFTNNYLHASGDNRPDLYVFEVGDFESVRVEISSDNVTYRNVGQTTATGLIDIDAFGIQPHERFFFVRLTDIAGQGATTGDSVGADIDAVGAITSSVNEIYTPGGVGIQVRDNVNPTLLNNILVNSATGIQVAADSSGTIVGGSLFHRNTRDLNGNVASNQFALSVGAATQLFVDPVGRILYPYQESPAIDSSINSLDDRPSLVALRSSLGMRASPILAPNYDINGMLRVDDPAVESPSGLGENVFKDRGAAERGDVIGPSAFVLNPLDNDNAGKDINPLTGTVEIVGESPRFFDIQLIDGAEQGLLSRGSGVNDSTVTSSSVIVYRNSDVLVEGVDYRFGYDTTNKVIRLTPLAGVWRSDAAYRVRLLGTREHVIQLSSPNGYLDDDLIEIFDADGKRFTFGLDLGYQVQVPVTTGEVHDLRDGETFTIDDGRRRVTFEIDLNGRVALGTIPVSLSDTNTPAEAAAKIVEAIRGTALNVTTALGVNGLFQILGDRAVILMAGGTSLSVTGSTGVNSGYGLRIPTVAGVAEGITDGQRFTITTGSGITATIELDTNGRVSNGNVPAFISNITSVNAVATAIVSAIRQAGLGLAPRHAGSGIILIGGDEETRIVLGNTVLTVVGSPGSPEAVPIPVNLGSASGSEGIAQSLATAIRAANLRGVTVLPMGSRLLIEGARGVVGPGVEIIPGIRDNAGNALLDNQVPKGTELFVFLGNGLDYGDAPDPIYQTKLSSNGPRHRVVAGFSLGATVTTDPDARAIDTDDGVRFTQDLTIGFNTSITVTAQGITAGRKGFLSAWIDFNGDGRFDSSEVLVLGRELVQGENEISFRVPAGSKVGSTWARFRYASSPILSPIGFAADGEVEDYQVNLKQNPYQNRSNQYDVNGDGRVSAIDVLQVINYMIVNGTGPLPFPPNATPPFVDVDGDGSVFPRDALAVINFLNQRSSGGGEGESSRDIFENSSVSVGFNINTFEAPAATSIGADGEVEIDTIDLGTITSSVVYGPLPLGLASSVRSFDFEESPVDAIFIDCSDRSKQKSVHDKALEEVFGDFE